MRLTLRAGLLTAPLFLLSLTSNAFADYVVDSVNPAWNQVGTDATFVLPATIPGCGTENATTCEPVGDFLIGTALAAMTRISLGRLRADTRLAFTKPAVIHRSAGSFAIVQDGFGGVNP